MEFRLTLSSMLHPDVEDGAILVYDKQSNTLKGTKIIIPPSSDDGEELEFAKEITPLEGTPLGGENSEYVVYDNKAKKMVYSNIPMTADREPLIFEGTPLGGNKMEFLAYNNSTKKIAYSNVEVGSLPSPPTDPSEPDPPPISSTKNYLFFTLKDDLTGIEFNPIVFDNIISKNNTDHLVYNNGIITFQEGGIYKMEIILDCIVLSNIDLPLDITTFILLNGTVVMEKIYSIKQVAETKFIKTELLSSFKVGDEVSVQVVSSAIDKGVTIKKSSSIMCYNI